MARSAVERFAANERGAVAPIIAVSLFALVALGGIAFDYTRMVSLDTELQSAADQAALAAATQLDGQTNACSRASQAARAMVANSTLMANDHGGMSIGVATESACDATGKIRFYQDAAKTTAATSDANAAYVEVEVNARQAHFALTPIVAAFTSGQLNGVALAGLQTSICKTPPVMICNPQETVSTTSFDVSALEGKGLKLVSVGSGGGSWAPGNFGYLNNNGGSNGAPGLREGLGWGVPPGDCVSATGVNTKPGASVSVTDALNTRFDIYEGSTSCPSGGSCGASINSVKDVARAADANNTGNGCRLHSQGWNEGTTSTASGWGTIPSSPSTALPTTTTPSIMGHPRDMCHAVPSATAGACTSPIGDGNWDRDAYFRTNYKRSGGSYWTSAEWKTNTGLGATAKRYDVYKWEIAHQGLTVDGVTVLGSRIISGSGASAFTAYGTPQCAASQGYSSVTPSTTTPDRRVLSVAVVNCLQNSVNGSSTNVPVKDWIDVFLVEPSINRGSVTTNGQIYVEVVGRTANATDEGAVQLIKKSVPYLIQ